MAKPVLTRSAALHLRLGPFGALVIALAMIFEPVTAFVLALTASAVLAWLWVAFRPSYSVWLAGGAIEYGNALNENILLVK